MLAELDKSDLFEKATAYHIFRNSLQYENSKFQLSVASRLPKMKASQDHAANSTQLK